MENIYKKQFRGQAPENCISQYKDWDSGSVQYYSEDLEVERQNVIDSHYNWVNLSACDSGRQLALCRVFLCLNRKYDISTNRGIDAAMLAVDADLLIEISKSPFSRWDDFGKNISYWPDYRWGESDQITPEEIIGYLRQSKRFIELRGLKSKISSDEFLESVEILLNLVSNLPFSCLPDRSSGQLIDVCYGGNKRAVRLGVREDVLNLLRDSRLRPTCYSLKTYEEDAA